MPRSPTASLKPPHGRCRFSDSLALASWLIGGRALSSQSDRTCYGQWKAASARRLARNLDLIRHPPNVAKFKSGGLGFEPVSLRPTPDGVVRPSAAVAWTVVNSPKMTLKCARGI